MKPFKFFQKEIRKFNVYEEMVLGILDYCGGNNINPVGYSHLFTITTLEGVQHKRIVIRNVTRYNSFPLRVYINIEYSLHLTQDNEEYTITNHTLTIDEDEYIELTEYHERV
jgi:hypothetical protein